MYQFKLIKACFICKDCKALIKYLAKTIKLRTGKWQVIKIRSVCDDCLKQKQRIRSKKKHEEKM